jgi:hypothetical protein
MDLECLGLAINATPASSLKTADPTNCGRITEGIGLFAIAPTLSDCRFAKFHDLGDFWDDLLVGVDCL